MPRIFVSFSTSDGGDIAKHLYGHYKEKGYDVFYSPEGIPYGYSWREEIRKHIEECDIFLFIATRGAIDSQEVAKEIEEAKRLEKRMIPCRPDDIEWSDLEKFGIDLTQGPEFRNEYELVRKLEKLEPQLARYPRLTEKKSKQEPMIVNRTNKENKRPSITRSWKWIAIGGGVVGVILISIIAINPTLAPDPPSTEPETGATTGTRTGVTDGNGRPTTDVSIVPGSSTLTPDEYQPNPVQVSVGNTVIWTNNDSQPHTVTSGSVENATLDGRFDSGILDPAATFSHTFDQAGYYPYFCLLHPNLIGAVTVSSGSMSGSEIEGRELMQQQGDAVNPELQTNLTVLYDNFDSENQGRGATNYYDFNNWFVLQGSVDLIGNNFNNLIPVSGLYVDLDGSTGMAGKLESRELFSLQPGEYVLQFDLAGSQGGLEGADKSSNTIKVSLGNVYEENFTLTWDSPLETIIRPISVSQPSEGRLAFDDLSTGDKMGLLLDNVKLYKVQGNN